MFAQHIVSQALWIAVVLCAPAPGLTAGEGAPADWVRAGLNTDRPFWGLRGGLNFGIHPGGKNPTGGPRGLIRITSPVLPGGQHDLVNFIAVEPVVRGRRGFSELEMSKLDGVAGKRIWPASATAEPGKSVALEPGKVTRLPTGVEQLVTTLRVERFDNGAHVYLVVAQRSDAPDEIELRVHAEPGSALVEYCFLTATMGNKARTRRLWLAGEVADSLKLYPDYTGDGFAPHTLYFLDRLHRTAQGDVLVAVTTDEANPAAVFPFPGTRLWYYGGEKVTQYWRKPQGTFRDDLHAAVNARYTYWQSRQPIPGGVAFENFELRERFHEGQRFVFGVTRRTPEQLGFTGKGPKAKPRENAP